MSGSYRPPPLSRTIGPYFVARDRHRPAETVGVRKGIISERGMRAGTPQPIRITTNDAELDGDLIPSVRGRGLVVFAHGSGSSRRSPRNRYVAYRLAQEGFGTLLFDLLTEEEDRDPRRRFDIPLLATRLSDVVRWLKRAGLTRNGLGLFGASTGSAAALIAAATLPHDIAAVVSRGGRPDLALSELPRVQAPTLLIVGSADAEVVDLNRAALEQLRCPKELHLVPGATHLFEEPGALDQVATIALQWFDRTIGGAPRAAMGPAA